jgi:uncharacterized damage-inducible protein DinB
MSNLEFCIDRRKAEMPAFVRVLKAIPADGLAYRPEPKARTAAELAWLFVSSEAALVTLLDTGTIEWKEAPPPARLEDIVAAFERNAAAVDERLAKLDDSGWEKKGRFVMGGGPPWEEKVSQFVWIFLFDLVHHRGQLSTYLRPMGGKVPSIYGPSADDSGK